ncbi:class I lanthipeptide [Flavobacteriaceae bacterium M23B6Z8]
MKKKKLNAGLALNKRTVSELHENAQERVKGGRTFYSCGCNQQTNYWDCSFQVQCTANC